MPYDASWQGLASPGLGPISVSDRFAGNEDARCADLARLAYFDFVSRAADLEAGLAGHDLRLAKSFKARWGIVDSEAFITVADDGTAYVVFRGTQNFHDVLTDIAFWPVAWSGAGRVHWGFRKGWSIVEKAIADWFADNQPSRIVVTGHSLGGALATLFAAQYSSAELVTFGCPLVGNAAFTAQFAGRRVQRYRNCCDLVPRVPPRLGIFEQLGGLNYIDQHGAVRDQVALAAITSDMAAGARFFARAKQGIFLPRRLTDHAPSNYVWALTGELTPP